MWNIVMPYMHFYTILIVLGLLSGIHCVWPWQIYKFRCNNGRFVPNHFFCDGFDGCGDNSDESYGCSYVCGEESFTCDDGHCISILERCNTQLNCADGSDETNCGHELNVDNCTMHNGKFLCKDKLRCLHLNETCDGYINCFDGSDEDDNCFKYDFDICHNCPHPCIRTPLGPRCLYQTRNNTYHSLYDDVEECNIFKNKCPQKCIVFQRKMQCSCSENYQMNIVNDCSTNVSYGRILIYSTSDKIEKLNLTSRESKTVQDNIIVTSLTAAHNYTFWSEMSDNHAIIFKKSIPIKDTRNITSTTSNEEELIYIDLNITSPITSIAIDWITNNVYFTWSKWLSVCSSDGRRCTHLKNSTFGIECVALTPKYGFMFWVQNGENKYFQAYIFKSAMDGSDEHILVQEKLRFSKSLIVDEASERLFWLDTELERIESIQFDGKGRKIVRASSKNYFSFAEFENKIYWTMEFSNTIFTELGFTNIMFVDENVTVEHLFVYNPLLQHTKIPNPCSSIPCEGLCLTRPSLTKKLDYSCACENFKPHYEQWCNNPEDFLTEKEEEMHHSTDKNLHLTSFKTESSTANNLVEVDRVTSPHLLDKREKGGHNGMKILFSFIAVVLVSVACYVIFKNWNKNRRRDDVMLIFTTKEDNNSE